MPEALRNRVGSYTAVLAALRFEQTEPPSPLARVADDPVAMRIYEALRMPFSAYNSDNPRLVSPYHLGVKLDKEKCSRFTLTAIDGVEPYVPRQPLFLKVRETCYKASNDPRLA